LFGTDAESFFYCCLSHRESADLERRFWNQALEGLPGQRLHREDGGASVQERFAVSQFWYLKQRRIHQLRLAEHQIRYELGR
jgi:hypothetical protein